MSYRVKNEFIRQTRPHGDADLRKLTHPAAWLTRRTSSRIAETSISELRATACRSSGENTTLSVYPCCCRISFSVSSAWWTSGNKEACRSIRTVTTVSVLLLPARHHFSMRVRITLRLYTTAAARFRMCLDELDASSSVWLFLGVPVAQRRDAAAPACWHISSTQRCTACP